MPQPRKTAAKKSKARKAAPKKKTAAKKASAAATKTRSAAGPKKRSPKKSSSKRASARVENKSVQAYVDALERSVTVPREWLQELVDDLVDRGRMTRSDANELASRVLSRGREQTDQLLNDLEGVLDNARKGVDANVKRVGKRATKARRAVVDAGDGPLARADQLRRRAGIPSVGGPITAYTELTVPQIKSRLKDLKAPELRKVRTQEKRGKGRKSILEAIEKQLSK